VSKGLQGSAFRSGKSDGSGPPITNLTDQKAISIGEHGRNSCSLVVGRLFRSGYLLRELLFVRLCFARLFFAADFEDFAAVFEGFAVDFEDLEADFVDLDADSVAGFEDFEAGFVIDLEADFAAAGFLLSVAALLFWVAAFLLELPSFGVA
jgi:hypothetical protein